MSCKLLICTDIGDHAEMQSYPKSDYDSLSRAGHNTSNVSGTGRTSEKRPNPAFDVLQQAKRAQRHLFFGLSIQLGRTFTHFSLVTQWAF